MAGVKISELPAQTTPLITDAIAAVNAGRTVQESLSDIATLFGVPSIGQLTGTTTNDDAAAGKVEQFISSVIPFASAISLTTATIVNLTSISLTAGDWNVWGNTFFSTTGQAVSGLSWISSTSVTLPDLSLVSQGNVPAALSNIGLSSSMMRFSLAGTTTIYLTLRSDFATSTVTACGGLYARRAR
jgi:hypothetical protein